MSQGNKLLKQRRFPQGKEGSIEQEEKEEPCLLANKFLNISLIHDFLSKHREYIFEYAVLQLRLITNETKTMQNLDSSRLLCLIRLINKCKEMIGDIIVNRRVTKTNESNWETALKARKPYFCWQPSTNV